ncbi:hypothetical protein [Burkholderia ubonensis]|nr:hypothetical protein [Burkholderia ubonensis]
MTRPAARDARHACFGAALAAVEPEICHDGRQRVTAQTRSRLGPP